jgi:hypothetical protein
MEKSLYAFIAMVLLLLTANPVQAQKNPDTLVISTTNGKIILVSDSLLKFAPMPTESLIRKALYEVLDSLPGSKSIKKKPIEKNAASYTKIVKKHMFRISQEFAVGLIRDKVSPIIGLGIEFAPQKQDYFLKKGGMYSFINIAARAAFTFREEENKYRTDHNTFLDFTLGNRMNPESGYKSVTELSGGIGYLVQRNGNYFDRNTFKIFANIGLPKSAIVISPEAYIAKSGVFPGLTVKLVNIVNYY